MKRLTATAGRRLVTPVTLMALVLLGGGCGRDLWRDTGSGKLAVRSDDHPDLLLRGRFDTALYRHIDRNTEVIVLLEGPPEAPTQAVIIRMMWRPRAARTPIDDTATNAVFHYLVWAGADRREMGIYSGGGYVYPRAKEGADTFKGSVWQGTLTLVDRTPGFADRLGKTIITGKFAAHRDDAEAEKTVRNLNLQIRNTLGYPRLVEGAKITAGRGAS